MPDDSRALEILRHGEIEVLGLLPYSSNYVFLANACFGGHEVKAVYKPRRGERPLWDFPGGTLAARELAAYLVGDAGGWGSVPATVVREDAPMGFGSLQLFIDHDPERHYFVLAEERVDEFAPFAAFDIVINNADRKAGHVIEDEVGRLWAVDHGLTFNVADKLRTVIWDFAGAPLPEGVVQILERTGEALEGDLGDALARLLSTEEVSASRQRTEALLTRGTFPEPDSRYRLPWPLI